MVDYGELAYNTYMDELKWEDDGGYPTFNSLRGDEKLAWEKVGLMVAYTGWRDHLTVREAATIKDAEEYSLNPFGDVAHNLKLLLAKLASHLDDK